MSFNLVKSIDVDATIEKLLNTYCKYLENLLCAKRKYVKKMQENGKKTESDKKFEIESLQRQEKALEYLKEIAKDPKKYLYTGKECLYTYVDGEGVPKTSEEIVREGEKQETMYGHDNLCDLAGLDIDRSFFDIFCVLSRAIAEYVRVNKDEQGKVKPWVVYPRYTGVKELLGWTQTYDGDVFSMDASKKIINLNKQVQLMMRNPLGRVSGEIKLARTFAVGR